MSPTTHSANVVGSQSDGTMVTINPLVSILETGTKTPSIAINCLVVKLIDGQLNHIPLVPDLLVVIERTSAVQHTLPDTRLRLPTLKDLSTLATRRRGRFVFPGGTWKIIPFTPFDNSVNPTPFMDTISPTSTLDHNGVCSNITNCLSYVYSCLWWMVPLNIYDLERKYTESTVPGTLG